jgi:hypothetical protein
MTSPNAFGVIPFGRLARMRAATSSIESVFPFLRLVHGPSFGTAPTVSRHRASVEHVPTAVEKPDDVPLVFLLHLALRASRSSWDIALGSPGPGEPYNSEAPARAGASAPVQARDSLACAFGLVLAEMQANGAR